MFVRTLIGREAGNIIELPLHAAEAALACGSAEQPTEAEVQAWIENGPVSTTGEDVVATIPPPYLAAPREDGLGYDVFDEPENEFREAREPLNDKPLPNLAAARDFVASHIVRAGVEIPDGWEQFNSADMRFLAASLGFPSPNKNAAATAIAAEVERRAI